ncbi:MAG TPA: hypothetical protein IGS37_10315 [Synechococcales cyanobacterium M55_K2018_004]|nr:hypothetical protein [Synechococcales cyanobacterium M55_K2018_004]
MQSIEVLRPSQPMDCIGVVIASRWLTPTIKSIRLELDRSDFCFLPGQSVWPKFERNGKTFSKIYSIASSPSRCPEIELCVSRVGWSSAFIQDLAVGETIAMRGPYGLMTLKQLPHRPRIYIAEGSGIAPLKSHIDWLREAGFRQSLWLVQSNPETPDALPYWEEWRSLSQRWPAFHYLEAVGVLPEVLLTRQGLNLSEFEIDICAVGDRTQQIQDVVLATSARLSQVRTEEFFAF